MKNLNLRRTPTLGICLIFASLVLMSSNCKKDKPVVKKDPKITNIKEASGYVGQTVTINGENFNDKATSTEVTFGTIKATITGGSTTTIVTTVPGSLMPGKYMVKAKVGEKTTNEEAFTVLDPADTVKPIVFTDFDPKEGKYGTTVTITGKNFIDGEIKVYINNKEQKPVEFVDSETIKVKVVKGTLSGLVQIEQRSKKEDIGTNYAYNYTYVVEDFSGQSGSDIAVAEDGTVYLQHQNYLLRYNKMGGDPDTITNAKITFAPKGLFRAEDGTLYMSVLAGGVLMKAKNSEKIDTLIFGDVNLQDNKIWHITGDNKGSLYVTTDPLKTIVKVNITAKTSEVLPTTFLENTYGIAYHADEDSLYVTTPKGLCKVHINGGDKNYVHETQMGEKGLGQAGITITEAGAVYLAVVDGGWLYGYTKKDGVKEILGPNELSMLKAFGVTNYGEKLLYITGDKTKKISLE